MTLLLCCAYMMWLCSVQTHFTIYSEANFFVLNQFEGFAVRGVVSLSVPSSSKFRICTPFFGRGGKFQSRKVRKTSRKQLIEVNELEFTFLFFAHFRLIEKYPHRSSFIFIFPGATTMIWMRMEKGFDWVSSKQPEMANRKRNNGLHFSAIEGFVTKHL